MKKITIEIVTTKTWLVPTFGNINPNPTGRLEIWYRDDNGDLIVTEKPMMDSCHWGNDDYYQYITLNRKRYMVKNVGSLYNPTFQLIPMRKCGRDWEVA